MKKYVLSGLLIGFLAFAVQAQDRSTKKADRYFSQFDYSSAVDQYKKLIQKKGETPYLNYQIGYAHLNMKNYTEAQKYLQAYLNAVSEEKIEKEFLWDYANLLKTVGKTDSSHVFLQKFADAYPQDSRSKAYKKNPDYLKDLMDKSDLFKLQKIDLSSGKQEFGAREYNGKFYFVSARNPANPTYDWNRQPTLDIYEADIKNTGLSRPKPVSGSVNSPFHEGTLAITQDGKTMYFTRNDYHAKKFGKNAKGVNQLKVYRANLKNGEWTDVTELPFSSSEYSVGNVALSPDEKILFFASDKPGGMGGTDLYKVAIKPNGEFGEPENLGSEINTPGDENFPFMDSDGVLYFSSDGHLGLGGWDVYKAVFDEEGKAQIENMGQEINSPYDDFSFAYYPDKSYGYVSSNRAEAERHKPIPTDQIYKVEKKETVQPKNPDKVETALSKKDVIKSPTEKDSISNIKKSVVFNPVFFDFDESRITSKMAAELDKTVQLMKENPHLKVLVKAHTDRSGSASYNLDLSQKRAENIVDYLVKKGISPERLIGQGVGFSEPFIGCAACTEEENAQNRRATISVQPE